MKSRVNLSKLQLMTKSDDLFSYAPLEFNIELSRNEMIKRRFWFRKEKESNWILNILLQRKAVCTVIRSGS